MKSIKITTLLFLSTTLIATSFAQERPENLRPEGRIEGGARIEFLGRPERPQNASGTIPMMRMENQENRQELRQDLKSIKDNYRAMTTSGVATATRMQVKQEIRKEVKEFRDERAENRNVLVETRILNSATATAKIATKLNLTPEELKIKLSATNTNLKDLIKTASLTKEEVREILPPIVKERIATTSQKFVPRILQNIFGPRKEVVTETVSEDGNVEVKVESKNGFFRNLFGF